VNDGIPYQVKQGAPGQAIGASLPKIWKSHSIPISTKIRLMKALLWSVATYGCESWTLRKNEETRLDAFEMKGLRKILQVSWTEKKTNEWVLNKAGVKRELLDTVKARKLAYYGHTMKKQGSCLEKEKRETMLFGKYLMHIGMKVSNRCSIIAPVSLYPSCYP